MERPLEDVAKAGDPVDVLGEPLPVLLVRVELGVHGARSVHEEGGDVDPARVALHLDRCVELERLGLDVEPEPGERVGIAVEERRRAAADDAVERGDPLLTVEEELFGTGGRRTTPHGLSAALGLPHEQGTDGEAVVHRLHQSADLVPVPDVATLELG